MDQWDKARQAYRQKAQQALHNLQVRLGEEAKRRLAQHYAVLVICASTEEVQAWQEVLNRVFKPKKQPYSTAFVRWEKLPIPDPRSPSGLTEQEIALMFWNGSGSMTESFVYAHELAHIVDHGPQDERLSKDPDWIQAWQLEKGRFDLLLADTKTLAETQKEPKEGFAIALAAAWSNPENAKNLFPKMYHFLSQKGLVSPPPSFS